MTTTTKKNRATFRNFTNSEKAEIERFAFINKCTLSAFKEGIVAMAVPSIDVTSDAVYEFNSGDIACDDTAPEGLIVEIYTR